MQRHSLTRAFAASKHKGVWGQNYILAHYYKHILALRICVLRNAQLTHSLIRNQSTESIDGNDFWLSYECTVLLNKQKNELVK